jgi:amino acid adenylation domain-containing protein
MKNVLEKQRPNDSSDRCDGTIDSRFEQQVAATPDSLAIVTDETSLSYQALDDKAGRIATGLSFLHSLDRPVTLFMQDEAARIAAMLGAFKANRIWISLAANSPTHWIAQVIQDSGTRHIIVDHCTRATAELAATGGVTVVEIEELARSSDLFVGGRSASPDDTAYIVYTSGSTGRPKGVANSHRRLIRTSDVRNRVAGVAPGDRSANVRSSGVSSWVRNSLSPLLSGGCLFPFDLHRHGLHELAPWLIAQEVTHVSFSSSLLRTWLASLSNDIRFPALRFVGATGERLYAQDVIRLSEHLAGDWRIGHSYSSSETGTIASQVFTSVRLPEAGIVAVGRPVDGVEVFIKDENGAVVPPGQMGEIVVHSRYLAQGYWNNPQLTAQVFETDPSDHAIRICHTGDLGRWRSDGTLEHMGRKGRRIRLRGYNIEPFQVESELMRQSGVTDAIVTLYDRANGQDPFLVGYVIASADASPSALREGLVERLPSYMVPSHIMVLDRFPLASSGKIDRNALPPPDWNARVLSARAPSDDCEHQLVGIWQEVLNLPTIEVEDDFFDLGGTSLQALMVFAAVEARLGCSLSPSVLVQAPTIARLAELIKASTRTASSQSLVPLRPSGTGRPLFLVHGRFYFAMHYRHLVRELKCDRPIYGLQPPPLDGKYPIARSIKSMADHCVAEIRRLQPHGPYFIAGHSFGGRVSFEIAQQFVREGEPVSFLGLIDTGLRDTSAEEQALVFEVSRLSHKARRADGFKDFLFRVLGFVRNEILFWHYDLRLRRGRPVPVEGRIMYYERLCGRANRSYAAKPYIGHITMFSSARNSEQQRADWGPVAGGGLTVLEVPAGHFEMALPPHSKILARHFDACLKACAC